MKILWLADTPIYNTDDGHNGRGWIESELELFRNFKNTTIGVAYNTRSQNAEVVRDQNFTFFPLKSNLAFKFKPLNIIPRWLGIYDNKRDLMQLKNIIEQFKPDIIYLFGSEWYGISVVNLTNIPVVVHIQGILIPYYYAFMPPSISEGSIFISGLRNVSSFFKGNSFYFIRKRFLKMAKREKECLPLVRYFMGRTQWDYSVTNLFSPNSQYYHLNEVLRKEFYFAKKWIYTADEAPNEIKVISTISNASYKGLDLIYKCCSIINLPKNIKLSWNICGICKDDEAVSLFSRKSSNKENISINYLGVVNTETLIDKLKSSFIYVHPSYIDNSPNSVCEAQYIGTPVITTNVGGLSSIVKDEYTGLLVPANDPCMLACKILDLYLHPQKAIYISRNEIFEATVRHDKENIKKEMLDIYNKILQNEILSNNCKLE